MDGPSTSSREELRSLLAPLYNAPWPLEETKSQRARELFAQFFDKALDDILKDREDNNYQLEDSLMKQVALQMEKVLSTLKLSSDIDEKTAQSDGSGVSEGHE
ncbi:uncharacterized protein LOC100905532 [Galendromus occidentalis]|uniref:Uncharacterized protein LOC100905532 n=1 Tax=Galendromus occidentalis TaxID=34638 RepID=A0AAJ6VY48_9ACAR|nr:uncharacterized protein LOC100905532 [Galendromus occidentalis]